MGVVLSVDEYIRVLDLHLFEMESPTSFNKASPRTSNVENRTAKI